MFFKYFLALFATLFLGPGIGHLFLKQYKKAGILIGIALFFVIAAAVVFMVSMDKSLLPRDFDEMSKYVSELLSQNARMMLIIDIPVAGAWAYAFLDILRSALVEYKENKKNEQ